MCTQCLYSNPACTACIPRGVETFSVGSIKDTEDSSTSGGWLRKNSTKAIMGTVRTTAQVHPRLLTKALLEKAVTRGNTKFLKGMNSQSICTENSIISGSETMH